MNIHLTYLLVIRVFTTAYLLSNKIIKQCQCQSRYDDRTSTICRMICFGRVISSSFSLVVESLGLGGGVELDERDSASSTL